MPIPKILIFSRRPADGNNLTKILVSEGYQVNWTDSGPEAMCQALSRELGAVIIFLQKKGYRELEYVPCLNRIDHTLPVIVISDHDSLKLQREVRQYKVFYYLPQPLDMEEIKAVLRDAMATFERKR